ncbi:wis1 [Candida oxycetoniae]|uniref:mitogen-activated protein kinase kinase n=1 Tax=Candida oxycetoniae TaxID=497107 RepID=A0AAI9WXH8_9ASCO|nr:wis1 [Candida oxycetoniae]KAI3404257.2 wis1 [Candida oxycetoniae]
MSSDGNNTKQCFSDIDTQFHGLRLDQLPKDADCQQLESAPPHIVSSPVLNNDSLSTASAAATATAAASTLTPKHTPLNSDIQARLMAFQQKRSKPASEPVNLYNPQNVQSTPPTTVSSNSDSIIETIKLATVPTPESAHTSASECKIEDTIIANDTKADFLHSTALTSASASASESALTSASAIATATATATASASASASSIPPPQLAGNGRSRAYSMSPRFGSLGGGGGGGEGGANTPELKKKPSLSQRRGMKLNTESLPLGASPINTPSSSCSPTTLNSAIKFENKNNKSPGEELNSPFALSMGKKLGTPNELSRRLSERKNKPNFKLNLDESNSNVPSRSNSVSRSARSSNGSQDSQDLESRGEPQLQGLFANYSKYIDIKSGQLNFAGKASLHSKGIDFSSGSSFRVSLEEFEYLEELGHGNYGSVSKVLHKPTGVLMAMKEVRLELDETKFTQILMELDILHKCDSSYIVDFYGAFFVEGAVYMCIEYMDGGSLDQNFGNTGVKDEAVLAYITESVIRGLKELKDVHNIIHRDVKPTNILVNSSGKVKLCDFGVSGNLVASMAKTNIGCQSYMAPERIKSTRPDEATYSVQSDIWSLGLTILEIAAGHYPYPPETYGNIFSQLSAIVDGEPPKLDPTIFSKQAQYFVKSCLNKNPDLRPSYGALLQHPWLLKYRGVETHLDKMVQKRLSELKEDTKNKLSTKRTVAVPRPPANVESVHSLLKGKVSRAPALHRGGFSTANKNFINR